MRWPTPAATFAHPAQVPHAEGLTKEEKKQALETWEADEKALARAADEGMTGGTPPRLSEVGKAKLHVEKTR